MPAGISISSPKRNWSGNVMALSFKARKGILGVEIKGRITVNDDNVIIEVGIPPILATFVSAETIRTMLTQKAEALLMEGSDSD